MDFRAWAIKYGWIQTKFTLRNDKTASAIFVLPSGKFAKVELADDNERVLAVMAVSVTDGTDNG
jgi:hypothetical protein